MKKNSLVLMVKVRFISHDASYVSNDGLVSVKGRSGEETLCIIEVDCSYLDNLISLASLQGSKRAILDQADCKRVWKRVKELQVVF